MVGWVRWAFPAEEVVSVCVSYGRFTAARTDTPNKEAGKWLCRYDCSPEALLLFVRAAGGRKRCSFPIT